MSSFGSRAVHCAAVPAIVLVAALGLVHAQSIGADLQVGPDLRETASIKASNAEAYDHFACGGGNQGHSGNSIALSGDGRTMAVGAPYESGGSRGIDGNPHDNSAYASGAVYVFVREGDRWVQQAYVKASNTGQSDHFGASVALSRDGHTMAVSAHWESSAAAGVNGNQHDESIRQAGAVYVFTRTGPTWTQQAYIKASNTGRAGEGDTPGDGDQFGYAVAISDDGNTIAAGAGDEDCLTPGINPPGCGDDSPPRGTANIWVGAAYVFARVGGVWTEQAFIKAANARPYNSFGVKLALSGDGRTLVVGAHNEDGAGNAADDSGAAYVFVY